MFSKNPRQFIIIIGFILSPTRLIIEYLLERCKDNKNPKPDTLIICWNKGLLFAEVIICVFFSLLSLTTWEKHFPLYTNYLLLWYALSRCNEIVYAFYCDSLERIDNQNPKTSLQSSQRIRLAIKSYGSLTLNFGFIHFLLPYSMYEPRFDTIVDALYFSGVTIATLGYGDIKPIHFLSKLFCVYEVFSGILLVVIAIAVYIGNLDNNTNY